MVAPAAARPASAIRAAPATMGPAKDGPFTPLVQLGRVVLGDQNLKKYRGKIISCARRRSDQTNLVLACEGIASSAALHACMLAAARRRPGA